MNVQAALAYDDAMAAYRFPGPHPMRPERFSSAVGLMREAGLVGHSRGTGGPHTAMALACPPADDDLLELIHDRTLIAAVRAAGVDAPAPCGRSEQAQTAAERAARFGIGPGDTPAFPGMHEAAALATGGTVAAMRAVLAADTVRAMSPAGGLHHAHRSRVAGFCIYNDCAVAIERATREHPGLRVAYVDIDAHHGDGVQEAFIGRSDVLTLSVHESGRYLYPGTGATRETGTGAGAGFALNVPLPPYAGDACYEQVLERIVAPALERFSPDVLVVQGGADTHRDDPLTHLDLTVDGYASLITRLVMLADDLCGGRIVLTGGGGYEYRVAAPRMWATAFAILCGERPLTWPERSQPPDAAIRDEAANLTARTIAELRELHPLLG